jgi:hypothetical protein
MLTLSIWLGAAVYYLLTKQLKAYQQVAEDAGYGGGPSSMKQLHLTLAPPPHAPLLRRP